MVAEFRRGRDLVVSRFRQELPGIEFVEPLGAFYFSFRVDSLGGTSGTEFCTRLITQSGVALVPGAAFGDDRYVRLSYAAATDGSVKALDRSARPPACWGSRGFAPRRYRSRPGLSAAP